MNRPPAAAPPTPHFAVLDGLRGVAALAVVVFHFMEFVVPDYTHSFIAHAYLAVDFFCLSGFVIASAYDIKLVQLGVGPFLLRRLVRLHPLVLLGSVLGLVTFVADPFSALYATYGPSVTGRMLLASCLLVPYPVVHERYFNLFHLNPPTWSLFWEYVANLLYALVLVRLRSQALGVLMVLASGSLCYEASHVGNLAVGFDGATFGGRRAHGRLVLSGPGPVSGGEHSPFSIGFSRAGHAAARGLCRAFRPYLELARRSPAGLGLFSRAGSLWGRGARLGAVGYGLPLERGAFVSALHGPLSVSLAFPQLFGARKARVLYASCLNSSGDLSAATARLSGAGGPGCARAPVPASAPTRRVSGPS
jgi:hypothetical protein